MIKREAKNRKIGKNEPEKKEEKLTFFEEVVSLAKTLIWAIFVVMIINGILVASFVVPTPSMERTVMTGDFLFVNRFIYGPTTPQIVPFLNIELPYYKFPGLWKPELSDVIVFVYPGDRNDIEPKEFQYFLKRCCGTPGDTIMLRNKQLIVNGKEVEFPETGIYRWEMPDHPVGFPMTENFSRDNYGPVIVPKKGDVIQLSPSNIRQWDVLIQREGSELSYDGKTIFIDGNPATEYTVKKDYYFAMGDNRDDSSDSRSWGFVPEENIVGTPMLVYWSWDTNLPMSKMIDKITSIRWGRLGTIIR